MIILECDICKTRVEELGQLVELDRRFRIYAVDHVCLSCQDAINEVNNWHQREFDEQRFRKVREYVDQLYTEKSKRKGRKIIKMAQERVGKAEKKGEKK